MNPARRFSFLLLAVMTVVGCTYYETTPGTYSTKPPSSKFDRSYTAAVGALHEQGVQITSEDRNAGIVHGFRNGINVSADVRSQADGRVRVSFNASGNTSQDPDLIHRITQSYNKLMGR